MKAFVLLAALSAAAPAPEPPAEGAPAPAFSLAAQDGGRVSLKGLKGKWVVLYFYPKDFTKGCTLEARGFQKKIAEFEARDAVVLGVSGQDSASHKSFCEQEGLSFKLLADTGLKVSRRYGTVLTHGDAELSARNTFLIAPDGKVAKRWLKVTPEGHPEELLAALDAAAGAKGLGRRFRPGQAVTVVRAAGT
jgi:thioredoxin-dependent peroxiredoxin